MAAKVRDDDPATIPQARLILLQRYYQLLRETGRGDVAAHVDKILNAPIKTWEDRC